MSDEKDDEAADDAADDEVPFEDMVAALLKVDPEGITGQRKAKKSKAREKDGSDAG